MLILKSNGPEPPNTRNGFQRNIGYRILLGVFVFVVSVLCLDALVGSANLRSIIASKPLENPGDLDEHFFSIPLDHDDPSGPTYQNRYWVNERHFKPGGPVFIFDSGEGGAPDHTQRFLFDPTSFVGGLLEEFHGIGIRWEHRYYKQSLPFPINESTTAQDFRYLTLNQSLADLPYFAQHWRPPSFPEVDVEPSKSPWVMVGCSYSGTRAALSRLMYPETFFASYAGSAPARFNATVDEFSDELYLAMVDYGYSNCAKDLHEIMVYIDAQLDDPLAAPLVKQRVLGPGAELNSNFAFAQAVNLIYAPFQASGFFDAKKGNAPIVSLCDHLEWDALRDAWAGEDGLATRYGAEFMVGRFASWPELLIQVNKALHTNCSTGDNQNDAFQSCNLTSGPTPSSWLWQQCSEMGWFVDEPASPHSLRSRHTSAENSVDQCQRFFPSTEDKSALTGVMSRVQQSNARYGGWNMRPSNVMWVTGQYDPWRSLTLLGRDQTEIVVSQDIPPCNVETGPDKVFGHLVTGAVHCPVLATNTTEVMQTRRLFADALHKWIKCF